MNISNMNDSPIILATLGILGSAVGAMVWVIRYFVTAFVKSEKSRIEAAIGQTKSNIKLEGTISKFQDYLTDRNGRDMRVHEKLLNGFKDLETNLTKIKNQTIEHQEVKESHIKKFKHEK